MVLYRKKNFRQMHKMDYVLFACVLKLVFWQLVDKLKQTKLYPELKIVINLDKSDLGPLGGYPLGYPLGVTPYE